MPRKFVRNFFATQMSLCLVFLFFVKPGLKKIQTIGCLYGKDGSLAKSNSMKQKETKAIKQSIQIKELK